MRIYLAGTFLTNWRAKVLNEIGILHDIIVPGLSPNHAIAHYTYHEELLIRQSDCMLAYFVNDITTPGTVWEMGVAYTLQRRIITVLENFKMPHETVLGISYRVFLDLDYTLKYFSLLKNIKDLQHESEAFYGFMK